MSLAGDIDKSLAQAKAQLEAFDKQTESQRVQIVKHIEALKEAQKLITPELEAVVEKLGVVLQR